jgi:IS1 family transposase
MDDAVKVFTLMTEGMSLRAISRVTDIHKTTILSLLNTVGEKCARLFDAKVQNVKPRFIQADEIWTFVQKKQKRLTMKDNPAERGDQYVWIALDSETKAVLSYYIGKRDGFSAYEFIGDLRHRVAEHHRRQLTTDGLEGYVPAVEEHFGADVDFAQLVKMYTTPTTSGPDWFRPSKVVRAIPTPNSGDPDSSRISTSHIERANLTLRMQMRRFTRLTNGFSKKLENLKAAVSVFMAWYNFCRVHQTLRVTPAMEAKLTEHVWTIRELLTAA